MSEGINILRPEASVICWKKPGYGSILVCLVCMFSILVIVPYKLTREEGIEMSELFNTSDWPLYLSSNSYKPNSAVKG
jgi:hypothetical protein